MDLSLINYNSSPYWSYPDSDSDASQGSRCTYSKFEPANCTFWSDYTGLHPAGEAAYARACELLLDAKEALLKAGGWVDENTVEDLFVLTSRSCTLAVPATLAALMDPEQTDMFANMFEALALLPITDSAQVDAAWPAFEDLVYLLQVLVPGLLLLIAEDKEQGRYVTRGLPPKEWVERRRNELEGIFGIEDYMRVCEAIEDGTDLHRGMLDEGREERETMKRGGWEEEFKRDWMASISGTDSDSEEGWGEDAVGWSSSGDDDFTYANETSSNWAEYSEDGVWPVDGL
ncbi:hypothetical protein EWM64_g6371 [Hericium alpestre]|uniref:Uncharacterized protein n=1 Tax=Hericium alpestre TaxID=135208 RepID=A0A4Y9ZS78_9AGAM|nr:hypothetical protein EWM64_g6371 [Hericium alpestre]